MLNSSNFVILIRAILCSMVQNYKLQLTNYELIKKKNLQIMRENLHAYTNN